MNTEDKEDKGGLGSFSEENMFNSEEFINSQDDEEQADINDFANQGFGEATEEDDKVIPDTTQKIVKKDLENEEEEEEEEEESDDINFESAKNEEELIDLQAFNKQFNTKFTKQEELKDFINKKESTEEASKDDEVIESADNYINLVSPLLKMDRQGRYLVGDEALMRKQLEQLAVADRKDLNNEDVQLEITTELNSLIDSGHLKYEAKDLRRSISENVKKLTGDKDVITTKRTNATALVQKEFKQDLQKEFIALHGMENFYGMENINKKLVAEAYRKATSGEFLESLKDKKVLAELSLMAALKEEIFKKSSGLTYDDGMKAILDEFKSKKKDTPAAKAQKRGTTANNQDTQKGLIDSILYTKPKEEVKT